MAWDHPQTINKDFDVARFTRRDLVSDNDSTLSMEMHVGISNMYQIARLHCFHGITRRHTSSPEIFEVIPVAVQDPTFDQYFRNDLISSEIPFLESKQDEPRMWRQVR